MANILTIQMQSKLGQIDENLKKIKSFLYSFRNHSLDLVVLPEFFATSIDYLKPEIDENGGYVQLTGSSTTEYAKTGESRSQKSGPEILLMT